jgi:hypothetical protein
VAIDLTIELDDTSGELARLGEALGAGGVNIEGLCAVTAGGPTAEVHVLVEDAEAAFEALAAANIPVESEREVVVIDIEDRPGELGEVSRLLGDAGVNITLTYLATNTRLVVGADDLPGAQRLLGGE